MTDQEINIAIAEACGWVWYRIPNPGKRDVEHRMLALPAIHEYPDQSPEWLVRANGSERMCNWEYMVREGHLSDYCHDLNSMADALDTLMDGELIGYVDQLLCLINEVDSGYYHRLEWAHGGDLITATARERAEAFLRTKGLWREAMAEGESQNTELTDRRGAGSVK